MACFSFGRCWIYSYIDQRNVPYSKDVVVMIVVDECIGDLSLIKITADVNGVSQYIWRQNDADDIAPLRPLTQRA
jgi:hypothetical protein